MPSASTSEIGAEELVDRAAAPVEPVAVLADVAATAALTFDRLAIDGLDAEGLRQALGEVRRLQRLVDGLAVTIGARADVLARHGRAAPASELLLGEGQVRGRTARQEAARSRVLAEWPSFDDAVRSGAVAGDQLDSVARRLGGLTEDERAAIDMDAVLNDARRLPADTFDAALRRRIERSCPVSIERRAASSRRRSEFRHWFDDATGMGRFVGALDPERYESLTSVVDHHMRTLAARTTIDGTAADSTAADGAAPTVTTLDARTAADALHDLVVGAGRPTGSGAPHLTVVVDARTLAGVRHAETICETGDGHDLSDEALGRLRCDATIRAVVLDEAGLPLHVGRRSRTATSAQWEAIRALHATCGWSGCERPLRWTQLHHIVPWHDGGPTDLDNLIPLCSEHHHRVHEGGWRIELATDRGVTIHRPDGVLHRCDPGPPTRAGPKAAP